VLALKCSSIYVRCCFGSENEAVVRREPVAIEPDEGGISFIVIYPISFVNCEIKLPEKETP